jgi:antitoxin component YwqK of YwqJK toxin-antitoxin module
MMRTAIIAILVILFSACDSSTREISFFAGVEKDTIYSYQDGGGYFVAQGLVDQLSQENVINAKLIVKFLEYGDSIVTELNNKNFYLTDTLYYGFRAEVYYPDYTTELIGKKPKQINYIGELEVRYSNGRVTSYLDSIHFTIIEPIKSDKMIGKLINGKREGKWLEFNDINKKEISRSSTFLNGLRNGTDTIFRNQQPYIITTWKQGKKDGYYRSYYPNGVVNSEMLFNDGKPIDPMYFFSNKGILIDSAYLFSENPTETFTSGSTTP